VDGNNLTGGLLHLSELTNEVPETRLCDRLVDGKDPHAVELGRGLLLGGKVASNHHVLSEASHLEDCEWCDSGSSGGKRVSIFVRVNWNNGRSHRETGIRGVDRASS